MTRPVDHLLAISKEAGEIARELRFHEEPRIRRLAELLSSATREYATLAYHLARTQDKLRPIRYAAEMEDDPDDSTTPNRRAV